MELYYNEQTVRRLYAQPVIFLGCAAICANLGAQVSRPVYTGPGSCSATPCHGSVVPRTENSVLQNEYTTWTLKDKHAQAYTVLTNEASIRMLKILNLPPPNNGPPEQAPKCLACHALDVPPAQQDKAFKLSEGVSCDSCHGPSSGWMSEHTRKDWNYEKSVQHGMYDTRNLVERSKKCLSCHVGNAEKSVDHEMLAAGHPDLFFELDSFEAVMPRHWKYPPDDDPWIGVRTLAVGEAVQLRASLQRLTVRAGRPNWPEYSELDCYACHHSLTSAKDSWRQTRGYDGRRPGDPPYNQSRFVVFRKIVDQFEPGVSDRLGTQMTQVDEEMSKLRPERSRVIERAGIASETAAGIVRRLMAAQFDDAIALQLMKSISADADAFSDERSAEQAAMALQSLYVGLSSNKKLDNPDLGNRIKALFQDFQNPSSYDPRVFAAKVHAINTLL
jgi:Cytochrome c554 and c-prime